MRVPPDAAACVELPGPWQHRYLSANGTRFHVVDTDPDAGPDAPTVVALHGFPEFWWAWRHQLRSLAEHGYRVVALDLRGFGGSDKPPRGYDTFTLAADVDGVIRSLGATSAVLLGHSWGGWITWAMPTLHPRTTRAIAVVGTAHPLRTMVAAVAPRHAPPLLRTLSFQLPMRPEHQIASADLVEQVLRARSATRGWPDQETIDRYTEAMRIPSAAHCSMEYYRWAFRSQFRQDGRRFRHAMRRRIRVPVLQLHGLGDPYVDRHHAEGSSRWTSENHTFTLLPGGHFLAEENPDGVSDALLDWLDRLD